MALSDALAIIASVALLLNAIAIWRKSKSESNEATAQAGHEAVDAVRSALETSRESVQECVEERDRLRRRNARLESAMLYVRSGVARLIRQLRDLDQAPAWQPRAEDFGEEVAAGGQHEAGDARED